MGQWICIVVWLYGLPRKISRVALLKLQGGVLSEGVCWSYTADILILQYIRRIQLNIFV